MGQIVNFESNAALPAHIQAAFGMTTNEDLTSGVSGGYPIISYKGKTWATVIGGERTLVLNEEGDPRSAIEVVIVKSNPNISKIYYPGGYEEGSTDKPTCYSNDGIAPGLDAEDIQSPKCGICQHNQWGSRITENGARGKSCSDLRRLAVAPALDLEMPMLLRVPAASLRELVTYAQMLQKRNTPYQAVVTKISFDPEAAYPKMQFKPVRWLDAEETAAVVGLMNSDVVGQITTLSMANVERDIEADKEAEDPMAHMGAPPAHVAPTAAPLAEAPKRRQGRPPKAAVAETQVAEALGETTTTEAPKSNGFGAATTPAPVAAQPATPAPSNADVLVASANDELDSMLADLGLDDDDQG